MRTISKFAFAVFAVAATWGLWDTAAAQETARNEEQAKVAISHVHRTADIAGLAVRNKQGDNLGKIDDLVIDMKKGEVRYAALAHGGVAGVGSKLFAVPWQKLTFVMGEPNNRNSRHFVFDVSKEQLENAEGFDSSNWPNVADPNWGAKVDKHFNVERKQEVKEGEGARVAFETVFRASKIKGMDVRNDANENLGSVDELVIDIGKGHVKYMALSFGSIFTGGNKLFAVPLSHCTLTHANDKTFIKLNVSQDTLKNAPGFDKNHWPDTANPNWAKEIDTYYQRTAGRTTTRQ
jgi:sporulation protein YlmC with PRC-barrel domain